MTPNPVALSKEVPYLECPLCGGPAIESETGIFYEDSGDTCMSCGEPGNVFVHEDDWSDEDSELHTATWEPADA
jgi:hypothetical protein